MSSKKSIKKNINELPSYEEWIVNSLKKKKEAVVYLQTALDDYQNDGNTEALLLALRYLAMAQGGVAELAKKTNLSRETLYRTLSKQGNPKLQTLGRLLSGLGFRLVVKAA